MNHGNAAPVPADGDCLSRLLLELRQSIELTCTALIRFELRPLEAQMEGQRELSRRIMAVVADAGTMGPAILPELRETAALNRVQAALVAGGRRAVQLELNLARLMHPETAPTYGKAAEFTDF